MIASTLAQASGSLILSSRNHSSLFSLYFDIFNQENTSISRSSHSLLAQPTLASLVPQSDSVVFLGGEITPTSILRHSAYDPENKMTQWNSRIFRKIVCKLH